MKHFLLFSSLVVVLASTTGCYNDKADKLYPTTGCSTDTVTYSSTVHTIMAQSCAISGCHDAASQSGGVILDAYTGVAAVATDGRLMGTVNHASGYTAMPQNASKLPDCQIAQLQQWVTNGAPNN